MHEARTNHQHQQSTIHADEPSNHYRSIRKTTSSLSAQARRRARHNYQTYSHSNPSRIYCKDGGQDFYKSQTAQQIQKQDRISRGFNHSILLIERPVDQFAQFAKPTFDSGPLRSKENEAADFQQR